MRHSQRPRRGTVAVLAALCMIGVLGFAALSLDAAVLHQDRRAAQSAADSAALAAAGNLFANWRTNKGQDPAGTAANEALAAAAANGFTNDGVNSTVTVNIPPLSGDHVGQAGYVEVIVQQFQQRAFSAVWGSDRVTVTARSVARGMWVPHNNGILVLDPTSSGSLSSNGGSNVTTNAKVIVDSSSASATVVTGGGVLAAPEFDITGIPGTSTSGGGTINGTIQDGQVPTPDPLAYLPEPDPSTMTVQSTKTVKLQNQGSLSLQPGVYQGGIQVTGEPDVGPRDLLHGRRGLLLQRDGVPERVGRPDRERPPEQFRYRQHHRDGGHQPQPDDDGPLPGPLPVADAGLDEHPDGVRGREWLGDGDFLRPARHAEGLRERRLERRLAVH